MKINYRFFLVCFFTIGLVKHSSAQRLLKTFGEPVFKVGEHLSYNIHYGLMPAGCLEMKTEESEMKFEGNPSTIRLEATLNTNFSMGLFHAVANKYDSYVSESSLLPEYATTTIKEKGKESSETISFKQHEGQVTSEKGTYETTKQTLDLLSLGYFIRNLDLEEVGKGELLLLHYYTEGLILPVIFQYSGTEVVITSLGKFKCLKFVSTVRPREIYKEGEDLTFWLTDDRNRIPVRAEIQGKLGKLKVDIVTAKGLKFPTMSLR